MLGLSGADYDMLMVNILLLIMGMFIDSIPILILAVPLILPLMKELDVNLVHLGAIAFLMLVW